MSRSTVRAEINGDVLAWAREVGGFDRERLGVAVGKTGQEIAAWERGEAAPTYRQLRQIAHRLRRPIATFFLPERPSEPDPTETMRRVPSPQSSPYSFELRLVIRTVRFLRRQLAEAREEGLSVPSAALPRASITDSPEHVASVLRSFVGVSVAEQMAWKNDRAYANWQSVLFDKGILVQQFSLSDEEAWGFALPDEDLPAIAINSQVEAPVARIFTLWHEVCHLLLRSPFVSVLDLGSTRAANSQEAKEETFCNQVSASFLMPLADELVASQLQKFAKRGTWDPRRVQLAASRFRVSKYVFAGRAADMGLLPLERLKELRREWWIADVAQARERRRKQRDAAKENSPRIPKWQMALSQRGARLSELVLDSVYEGKLDIQVASEILQVAPSQFPRMHEQLLRGVQE